MTSSSTAEHHRQGSTKRSNVSATVIDEDEMVASFTNIENDSAIDSGVDDDEVKTLFVCLGVFTKSL